MARTEHIVRTNTPGERSPATINTVAGISQHPERQHRIQQRLELAVTVCSLQALKKLHDPTFDIKLDQRQQEANERVRSTPQTQTILHERINQVKEKMPKKRPLTAREEHAIAEQEEARMCAENVVNTYFSNGQALGQYRDFFQRIGYTQIPEHIHSEEQLQAVQHTLVNYFADSTKGFYVSFCDENGTANLANTLTKRLVSIPQDDQQLHHEIQSIRNLLAEPPIHHFLSGILASEAAGDETAFTAFQGTVEQRIATALDIYNLNLLSNATYQAYEAEPLRPHEQEMFDYIDATANPVPIPTVTTADLPPEPLLQEPTAPPQITTEPLTYDSARPQRLAHPAPSEPPTDFVERMITILSQAQYPDGDTLRVNWKEISENLQVQQRGKNTYAYPETMGAHIEMVEGALAYVNNFAPEPAHTSSPLVEQVQPISVLMLPKDQINRSAGGADGSLMTLFLDPHEESLVENAQQAIHEGTHILFGQAFGACKSMSLTEGVAEFIMHSIDTSFEPASRQGPEVPFLRFIAERSDQMPLSHTGVIFMKTGKKQPESSEYQHAYGYGTRLIEVLTHNYGWEVVKRIIATASRDELIDPQTSFAYIHQGRKVPGLSEAQLNSYCLSVNGINPTVVKRLLHTHITNLYGVQVAGRRSA